MDKIKTLYYQRFLQHVVEEFSTTLKAAKAGHCMKITGLAMKELKQLLPMLRPLNDKMESYILSETESGSDFIHATKLIELRNNHEIALLILVPSNSRTSAEDSYGDATFQNLSSSSLVGSFVNKLIDEMPADKKFIFDNLSESIKELSPSRQAFINYLLYLEMNQYSDEAWGNGLYLFDMLPDRDLIKNENTIRRRFLLNLEKVSEVLGDFSMTASDRISALPIKRNTIQKSLMAFLTLDDDILDKATLFEKIHDEHPEFNYASLPWIQKDDDEKPVSVTIEIIPGKDPSKELVKDSNNDLVLSIPPEKKGKITFSITSDPAPKDNPDICWFEISLINIDDFQEVGTLKRVKITTNKRATRKLSYNMGNGLFADGQYMLRVTALDENKLPLPAAVTFKEASIESDWLDAKEQNPNLQREQFRLEKSVAYSNESDAFTIDNTGESEDGGTIDKRSKTNSLTQAIIHYKSSHLAKGEDTEIPEEGLDEKALEEGALNSKYTFDFGPSYAYQIQLSNKLMQLENAFLNNPDKFGYVEALLTGNPTDVYLLDPKDTAKRVPKFAVLEGIEIPEELVELRLKLLTAIKGSIKNGAGLTCTFDIPGNLGLIRDYLSEYERWMRELLESDLPENAVYALQNLDTARLSVEMPDGSLTSIKLIAPLHPLRLAWIVNLYELYLDWETKTVDNPKYRKFWYRKLDKLFQGELPMDIAPLVFGEESLKEAYQYIGELTYGWGAYAQPDNTGNKTFASNYRQLKSYTAMQLNVTREKRIDSDVSLNLVVRHLMNYCLSHPYTDKVIINLFNAGDAAIFAQALVEMEKLNLGQELIYEIRLFTSDSTLQAGEAFKLLLAPDVAKAPEAEVFSQASTNRLFPKLRFSLNNISDFINNHDQYQAHISFLVNPFVVHTELIRPDELNRSFYLNGTICRNVVLSKPEGKTYVWNRYISNKVLPYPVSEFANTEVSIFARLQEATGKLLSSTLEESVPSTTLRLKESDLMLLSFVHEVSDWVVTFDKNMGPELYDLPCLGEHDIPYLLDYIPGEETTGISSFLTTRPTSEIASLMVPLFKEYGIDLEKYENFREILDDVRAVSSSLIMQTNATSRKGFEVIGTTLTKRLLEKKGIMKQSFLIPIDLHKELFVDLDNDNKERADTLVVKIDPKKKEILFTVVEIKCRNANYNAEELHAKMMDQIKNTQFALRSHFESLSSDGDRLDRELKTLELKSLLEFYINRAIRYNQLAPEYAHEYLSFLSKLGDVYTLRFKDLGIVFDFQQQERQKKDFFGDGIIYTMGAPVITNILNSHETLSTNKLEALDNDFYKFLEYSDEPISESQENDIEIPVDNEDDIVEIVPQSINTDVPSASESQRQIEEHTDGNDSAEQGKKSSSESSESVDNQSNDESQTDSSQKENTFEESEEENNQPEQEIKEELHVPNYQQPKCDVIIGKNGESPQFGIFGKVISNGRVIGLDLNECNTISLFGVQGAGKSYTIGSIAEMVLRQFSNVNLLPAPMAGVIFHYSDSMDYAPEFTSMVYPNDEAGQLAKLKAEYGAEPGSIKDVVLIAPESQVEQRNAEYPDIEVHSIGFDSSELSVKDWMFLLGAMGNDSTYIKQLKQIMKGCRNNMSLANIRAGVEDCASFNNSQRALAQQKLDFAEEYITDDTRLQQYLKPGRLIIVDLRDEFIEKDDALGLFVVMLNIFSGVMQVNGRAFNKFIVFDEAHKYMNNRDLVGSITTAIREMRHKGVSIMIASQDPMSLPTEIIELSSIIVMHRFSSPSWVKHVQKAITPLQTLTPTEMSNLGSGEAYLWANKASDKAITQRPVKISIRPRVTKHGGDTIQAVK